MRFVCFFSVFVVNPFKHSIQSLLSYFHSFHYNSFLVEISPALHQHCESFMYMYSYKTKVCHTPVYTQGDKAMDLTLKSQFALKTSALHLSLAANHSNAKRDEIQTKLNSTNSRSLVSGPHTVWWQQKHMWYV